MRIVQVLTQTTGGPADHVVDVAAALAARGHDSHVVGPASERRTELAAAGVTWHTASMGHKLDGRGAAAIVSQLRRLCPDVVHGQDRRAGWIVRGLGPVLRARCVYTLHGVPDGLADLVEGNVRAAPRRRRDRLYYLWGERLVTRWSGGVVVVPSEAVARYAVAHVGLPDRLVHVVHNGVDPAAWVPAEADRVGADGSLVVAWVGLLGTVKRVDVLLRAVEQVPGISVLLAGDGPLRDEVEREVHRRGLDGRVRMLGMVADVRPVLGAADLFVLTSAAENLPMALLQAMSSGLPSVVSAVGGVPELVRHDVEGWLVPAGDVAATAAALAHALVHRSELAAMGARARARVIDGWTLDQCVDRLVDVYADR
ncbi:glycosyltransferase family 4 protein [Nocardioides plantarum]|uniref:Glycosyltransferase family 4 protein n=1 Tax=Nocardioides plantarum TaxID=29299 RepID=A0ABV5K517_9ACTN|nr:glycosyltransferase family 4 protein [Nocardioides plantarum]